MPTNSKPSAGGPVAHSPAPWRRFGGIVMAADDKQVCAMVPTDDQGSHLRSIAEDDANQSLIAAAPELLDMLTEARGQLVDLNQSENDGGAFLSRIDSLILKATA